jgi:RNA polymerase sigma-70 factor (ECF subfamily)
LDEHRAAVIEDPADDPEISAQKQDRSATIQRCLSQLSSAHRQALDLIYYHGRTLEEVAQIVGAPLSTIKTRMFYARRRMEKLLAGAGLDKSSLH